jgi:hypothetical protein
MALLSPSVRVLADAVDTIGPTDVVPGAVVPFVTAHVGKGIATCQAEPRFIG